MEQQSEIGTAAQVTDGETSEMTSFLICCLGSEVEDVLPGWSV